MNSGPHIWLIDRRPYWRDLFGSALVRRGFLVTSTGEYGQRPPAAAPDLVVLACTAVALPERRLIESIACWHHRLLVLAATFPIDVMRDVFRAGAYDATAMPVRATELVEIVEETLARSEQVLRPHSLLIREA